MSKAKTKEAPEEVLASWNALQALLDAFEERLLIRPLRIAGLGEAQAERQHISVESRVDCPELHQAADEKARAGQQREGECDLGHDEPPT